MRNLEMSWNREKGRLVCHWVYSRQQRPPLNAASVPGSAIVTVRSARASAARSR